MTFSIRMRQSQIDQVKAECDAMDYSLNGFITEAALGCAEMINVPPGKQIPVPKIVRIGRHLKYTQEFLELSAKA